MLRDCRPGEGSRDRADQRNIFRSGIEAQGGRGLAGGGERYRKKHQLPGRGSRWAGNQKEKKNAAFKDVKLSDLKS